MVLRFAARTRSTTYSCVKGNRGEFPKRELNWVVTPADGPFVGIASRFFSRKALSSAKIDRTKIALCLHKSNFWTVKLHRAQARDRAGAKRKRGWHCGLNCAGQHRGLKIACYGLHHNGIKYTYEKNAVKYTQDQKFRYIFT